MSQTTYTIENAKSGRSTCKKCKEKIGKGELRIGVHSDAGDYQMTSWYHPKCYSIPKKLVKQGIDASAFVTTMLENNTSSENYVNEHENELIQLFEKKAKGEAKSEQGVTKSSEDPIRKIKENLDRIRKINDLDDSEVKEEGKIRGKKKAKTKSAEGALSKDDEDIAKAYEFYESYKNDELKDVLRWNQQKVTGTRSILFQRIIDGQVNGRLGMCPSCIEGKLKLSDEDWNTVICNGYFDKDTMVRVPCMFKCTKDEAPRLHKWFTQKPTEEEEEDIKALIEKKNGKNQDSALTDKNSPLSILQSLAQAMEKEGKWDLSSPSTMKASAKAMLKLCTELENKLDLPSSGSKTMVEIGKLILQNKSASASDFAGILAEKYGFITENAEKNQSRSEKASILCKSSTNGPLMAVMLELAELYFKEKNTNAGLTYKKVAEAIKNLTFEITGDNAKGLGKGKTKVAGIGKASADKIYEFVTTGTMEKLEEKRLSA